MIPSEEDNDRYERLLAAVTSYRYTVRLREGVPVATEHTEGCRGATGYGPEDYARDPYLWFSMIHPHDRARVSRHVQTVLRGEAVPPIEHRIVHRNGMTRWIRDTILLHRDEHGQLDRYDGLVEDITDRRQLEQRLRANEARMLAAQRIQERLLPGVPPKIAGLDVGAAVWPAEFVAGDYFDYFAMEKGQLMVAVGDVSGHGVGPALLAAYTHAVVRSLSRLHLELDEILHNVNRVLWEDKTEQFVTLLLARVDPPAGALVYLNAGHPTGYVIDCGSNVKTMLESQTVPLGVSPDTPFPHPVSVQLYRGDTVLLVSDGVLEATAGTGESFGTGRLLAAARRLLGRRAREIVAGLGSAVREFAVEQTPRDDMTVLVLKWEPPG